MVAAHDSPDDAYNAGQAYWELLDEALLDDEARETIVSLKKHKQVLRCMEDIFKMMNSGIRTPEERLPLRHLLLELSKHSGKLPGWLFLHGIEFIDWNPVGRGSSGDVFRGSRKLAPVALKRLRIDQTSKRSKDAIEGLCREAMLWKRLKHPYVLPFLGIDRETFKPFHTIVSPWMYLGDINRVIGELLNHPQSTGESVPLSEWILQIAQGLQYLHYEQIVHGNLRGSNVLIGLDKCVRLADFGMSQFADRILGSASPGPRVRWFAPEVLRGANHSFASDIYSFGCLWLELYTCQRPFDDIPSDKEVIRKKTQEHVLPNWPSQSGHPRMRLCQEDWKFIASCWNEDPSRRPTANALMKLCADACAVHELHLYGPEEELRAQSDHDSLLDTLVQAFFP